MQGPDGSPLPKGPRRGQAKQANGQPNATATPQRSQRRPHQQQVDMQQHSPAQHAHNHQAPNGRNTRQPKQPHPMNKSATTASVGLDGTSSVTSSAHTSTPVKQTAYAGPTFHASPAPSSLPIPRFFSKSVPNAASGSGLQARLDASPSRVPPSPSPHSGVVTPVRREESPLDLLFNAHRAEQAKQNTDSPRASSLAPEPRYTGRHAQPQPSGKELFMMELDGSGEPSTAATTTPFRERLDAIRGTSTGMDGYQQINVDEQQRREKSAALKRMLNVQQGQGVSGNMAFGQPPQAAYASGHALQSGNGTHTSTTQGFTSQQNATPHPVTSGHSPQPDVKSMEADLRRMLKIGPS